MQSTEENVMFKKHISIDEIKCLCSGSYDLVLSSLKFCSPVKNLTIQQIENLINNIGVIIQDEAIMSRRTQDLTIQIFKVLRNLCTLGNDIQTKISLLPHFFTVVTQQIESHDIASGTKLVIFQCLANICVQNNQTQSLIWNKTKEILLENLNVHSDFHKVVAMILYYTFIDDSNTFIFNHDIIIFKKLINIVFDLNQEPDANEEFTNLFIEYFLIKYEKMVEIYSRLEIEARINTVKYCIELVKAEDHNRCLNKNLIVFLLNDFKKKSDLVLNVKASTQACLEPQEIIIILELVTNLSSSNLYTWILHQDKSLFLNIGCLLISIHDLGKLSDNVFTPAPKLADFVTSRDNINPHENDISYEFKTMLVRCIANLSYKNVANQNLARDVKILLTVLECTNMDAKNPLIKEWSILAIRNLCENNQKNQSLIKTLNKMGDSLSSIVVDDGRTDNGSIRIKLNNI